jgi:hypothetical protein
MPKITNFQAPYLTSDFKGPSSLEEGGYSPIFSSDGVIDVTQLVSAVGLNFLSDVDAALRHENFRTEYLLQNPQIYSHNGAAVYNCVSPEMLRLIFAGTRRSLLKSARKAISLKFFGEELSYPELAIHALNLNVTRCLVEEFGVDENWQCAGGRNLLHYAAYNNEDSKVFAYLLTRFPELAKAKDDIDGYAIDGFLTNVSDDFFYHLMSDNDSKDSLRHDSFPAGGNILHQMTSIAVRIKDEELDCDIDFNKRMLVLVQNFPELIDKPNAAGATPFANAFHHLGNLDLCAKMLEINPEILAKDKSLSEEEKIEVFTRSGSLKYKMAKQEYLISFIDAGLLELSNHLLELIDEKSLAQSKVEVEKIIFDASASGDRARAEKFSQGFKRILKRQGLEEASPINPRKEKSVEATIPSCPSTGFEIPQPSAIPFGETDRLGRLDAGLLGRQKF